MTNRARRITGLACLWAASAVAVLVNLGWPLLYVPGPALVALPGLVICLCVASIWGCGAVSAAGLGLVPAPRDRVEGLRATTILAWAYLAANLAAGLVMAAGLSSRWRPSRDVYEDIVGAVVMAPIAEELLFRGLLWASVRRACGRDGVTVLLTSALFGLAHVPGGGWPQATYAAVLGVGLALSRRATGSILPAVLAHSVFNAVTVTMMALRP